MAMKWFMLTLVGKDRPGIVAHVSSALYDAGCNLGEASMIRLGGNFTIMLMVHSAGGERQLQQVIAPVAESLGLRVHVDPMDGRLHQHIEPDVSITVYGADRAGIVAHVTGALAQAGLNILDLESNVGGTEAAPVYILHIEGQALEGIDALASALDVVRSEGINATITPIDTMVG